MRNVKKLGFPPLELDSTLTAAAQIRAKEIIEVFDHTRPNGKACKTVLEELGYERRLMLARTSVKVLSRNRKVQWNYGWILKVIERIS